MTQVSQDKGKSLQNIRFLAWRVGKQKQSRKMESVHRLLNERPRQRSVTKH